MNTWNYVYRHLLSRFGFHIFSLDSGTILNAGQMWINAIAFSLQLNLALECIYLGYGMWSRINYAVGFALSKYPKITAILVVEKMQLTFFAIEVVVVQTTIAHLLFLDRSKYTMHILLGCHSDNGSRQTFRHGLFSSASLFFTILTV